MESIIVKGEIPFVRILIPLIFGITFAICLPPDSGNFHVVQNSQFIVLTTFAFFLAFYQKLHFYKHKWVGGFLFSLAISLFGFVLCVNKSQKLNQNHFSKTTQKHLVLLIASEPKLSNDILRFEAEAQQRITGNQFLKSSGNLMVALKSDSSKFRSYKYGDLILIPPNFTEIDPPFNPNEFNFKKYLANKAIYHQTFINSTNIKILAQNKGNIVIQFSLKLRKKLVDRFNLYIEDKNAAAVASTLILGYRADLNKVILDAYSKTGTMHVLSVSGMHVGIIFLVIAFLLGFMDKTQKLKVFRAIILLTLIWAYTTITGFSSAACRAAIMLSFIVIGKAINRGQNTYNLVAISAVLLLLYNPFYLVDVGFQLSYLAVIGLVYLYPKIYHCCTFKNYASDKIWSYTALSIAAQIATSPLSLFYFHQFPLYFLLSNLVIVLPVTLIMYAGLIFVLFPFAVVSQPIGWILNRSLIFTNEMLFQIENLPFASINKIWISPTQYLLIYLFIIFLVFYISFQKKLFVWASGFTLLLLVAINAGNKIKRQDNRQIVFYSLRKNTAIGFIENQKAYLLTDLPDRDKTYSFSVMPDLDALGATQLNYLTPGRSFENRSIYFRDNYLQYGNYKILVWNKKYNKRNFKKAIKVDALVLSGNPKTSIPLIQNTVKFRVLLIDGTNNDYNSSKWFKEAKTLGVECYILKKKPAYVVKL